MREKGQAKFDYFRPRMCDLAFLRSKVTDHINRNKKLSHNDWRFTHALVALKYRLDPSSSFESIFDNDEQSSI